MIAKLNNPESPHPKCFIINEIGGICFGNDKELRKRAEEFLRDLLENKDYEDERDIVFCWLSVIENPDSQTIALIKKFKKDPVNQEVIEDAQDKIDRFNLVCK